MWCPSLSLSVWANAWLAGAAAPDDVLDALSLWAPTHSVTAYDSVAATRTGLPWPDLTDAGAVSLLQTVRTAAGAPGHAPTIGVVLPVPGDVRGLPAGTQFQRDAITAGEAIVVAGDPSAAIGLVPEFEYDEIDDGSEFEPDPCALSWTVYSTAGVTPPRGSRSRRRRARTAFGGPFGGRRTGCSAGGRGGRGHRRPARTRRTSAGIRAPAPGSRPRTDAGAARSGERGPHRRDHHGQFRLDPDRDAQLRGGADRQRRTAALERRGALGADGRRERDSVFGVARLARATGSRPCTPRR